MKKVWTERMIRVLRREYPTADLDALASKLGVSRDAVKTKATLLKVKRASREWVWNDKKRATLIALYPEHTNAEIAKMLNVTESSVSVQAFKLRLFKTEDFHKRMRQRTQFQKGRTPENKGKKWDAFMSKNGQEGSRKTTFKKGNIPPNHKEVGYERMTRDGYIEVKVSEPNMFKLKHRLIWEQHNGKIPHGCNIQFHDNNRLNCNIENLYIISRREQISQNTIMRYPNELRTAIKRVSKIKRLIKEL